MRLKKRYLTFGITIGILVIIGLLITPDRSLEELKKKYANEHSQFIEVNDLQVHYRDQGNGIPIVLLHGTAASLHTWNDWTDYLKDEYRIIRLDLPAFGLTGPNESGNYDMDFYIDFLNRFVSKIEVDSFHLAGNSLGGGIAWNYALKYPDKVKKLVLLDATGFPRDGEPALIFKLAKTPVINQAFKYITPKSFVHKNLKEVYYSDSLITDELVTRYHDMALREGNRQAFIDRAQTAFEDRSNEIQNLSMPTLIIWGKHDEWIPLEDAYKFEKAIPSAKLAVIENTGHIPMEEKPKETVEITRRFLSN